MMQLIDSQTQKLLLSNVEVAKTFRQRFQGMMLRRTFRDGYGLWLEPCGSVHTMWMRVSIDIFFIDKDKVIVDQRLAVKPWSIVRPRQRCHSVLEIPESTATLALGTQLTLQNQKLRGNR